MRTALAMLALTATFLALAGGSAYGKPSLVVTTTADSGPGSLRQAILDANANPGPDTISFDIPGAGVHVIAPLTDLPLIGDPVTIDGTTQPGYAGTPLVWLRGPGSPNFGDCEVTHAAGLDLYTNKSTIRGLAIGGFNTGIAISASGSDNAITGNVVGANPLGVDADPNECGIAIRIGARNVIGGTTIGTGNLISGNKLYGVTIEGKDNKVEGNLIGTTGDGLHALPNGLDGIVVGSANSSTDDNTIGGPGLSGNVISGNLEDGVLVGGGPLSGPPIPGAIIQGNRIGTNADGTAALPNGLNGVEVDGATRTVIGGPLPLGVGNVISGNGAAGVQLGTSSVDVPLIGAIGVQVSGNLIGTSADGQHLIPNAVGVDLLGSHRNLIGRSTGPTFFRGGANVISGNAYGVLLREGGDNTVTGNVIGLAGDGTTPLGNQYGVWIDQGETGSTIGTPKDPNTIAGNTSTGVTVAGGVSPSGGDPAFGDTISANSIFGNGALGIDLNADGVTANDINDPDDGPNVLQNFPVITSVSHQGGQLVLGAMLNSRPFGQYRIEFFANSSCDPSGHGEGETYLGAKTVFADPFGNVSFSAKFPLNPSAATPAVTATATDLSGNTSEFSACGPTG